MQREKKVSFVYTKAEKNIKYVANIAQIYDSLLNR